MICLSCNLSWYVSDCTVSVSLRRMNHSNLSWYVSECTVSVSYVYHSNLSWYVSDCTVSVQWWFYHSDLSWYVSDCTVSVSLRRWYVYHSDLSWYVSEWYCISITKKNDMSITVMYHGMYLTVSVLILYQY